MLNPMLMAYAMPWPIRMAHTALRLMAMPMPPQPHAPPKGAGHIWGRGVTREPFSRDVPLPPTLVRLAAVLVDIAKKDMKASTGDEAKLDDN